MPHAGTAHSSSREALQGGWSRRRLIAILVAAGLAAAMLATAFCFGVYRAVTPAPGRTHDRSLASTVDGQFLESMDATGPERRDAVAAAPMLVVPPSAAHPPAAANGFGVSGPGTAGGRSIEIPVGDAVPGPALVMSGFPPTPQGAIGQLAQIDVAVLQSMNLATAREVHAAWALPGGAGPEEWWITASVRAFLDAASMAAAKDPAVWVQVEPVAALVKGTDGPDWSTVCVLLRVSAAYRSNGEVALGHCERMQWVGGRWMIAPGAPPAPAPSTWPGTPLAVQAGWARWTRLDTPSSAPEADSAHERELASSSLPTSDVSHDEAGVVATTAELARAQIGFDYAQAETIATAYAAPGSGPYYASRARAAVRARRTAAGLGLTGEPRAPASFAVTPLAYRVTSVAPDRYAVHLLSWVTLTTVEARMRDHAQVDTYLLAWSDARSDHGSDDGSDRSIGWRLSRPHPEEVDELTVQRPSVPHLADLDTGTAGWTSLGDVTAWD